MLKDMKLVLGDVIDEVKASLGRIRTRCPLLHPRVTMNSAATKKYTEISHQKQLRLHQFKLYFYLFNKIVSGWEKMCFDGCNLEDSDTITISF